MVKPAADYFVSYTRADRAWAEWIAWELEQAGHRVIIQAWDFRPGTHFVQEMHKGALATRTVAVLSQAYLEAGFPTSEWQTAFAQDPTGEGRSLLPIRVEACEPDGLLKTVTYLDLVGLGEASAREALRTASDPTVPRLKPAAAPPFPGNAPPYPAGAVADPGQGVTRVVFADDEEWLLAPGMRAVLEIEGDLKLTGTFATAEEALSYVTSAGADVAVVDLDFAAGGMGGIEFAAMVRERELPVSVLVFTKSKAARDIFDAMQAGIRGYLVKGELRDDSELRESIRLSSRGAGFVATAAAAAALAHLDERQL